VKYQSFWGNNILSTRPQKVDGITLVTFCWHTPSYNSYLWSYNFPNV